MKKKTKELFLKWWMKEYPGVPPPGRKFSGVAEEQIASIERVLDVAIFIYERVSIFVKGEAMIGEWQFGYSLIHRLN